MDIRVDGLVMLLFATRLNLLTMVLKRQKVRIHHPVFLVRFVARRYRSEQGRLGRKLGYVALGSRPSEQLVGGKSLPVYE